MPSFTLIVRRRAATASEKLNFVAGLAGLLVLFAGLTVEANAQDRPPKGSKQVAAERHDKNDTASQTDGIEGSQFSDRPRGTAQTDQNPSRLLADPFEEPQQVLRLLDIGESELNSFVNGQPISPDDEEALIKILFRLPQVGLDDIHRWQEPIVPWASLAAQSGAMQTKFFALRGRVHAIERHALRPRLATLFGFGHYFQVRLVSSDTQHTAIICTRVIPRAWQDFQRGDERASAAGMFLKVGPTRDGKPHMVFAAQRVAWMPDRVEPSLGINPNHVLLGNLGMDVGLYDLVRGRNRLPIGASERECFYQLLKAVKGAQPPLLFKQAHEVELRPLLQYPETKHGDLMVVHGTARQITKVVVDEPDVRKRFDIDHYYQLDILVPLGDQVVEVRGKEADKPSPSYDNNFPFTFCVARLPERWRELAGRGQVNEPVAICGFFFKLWAYQNQFVAQFDEQQRQLCPMFIALEPGEHQPAVTPRTGSSVAAGIGFLLLLLVVWGVVWYFHRSDRKFARSLMYDRFKPANGKTLDHLNDQP